MQAQSSRAQHRPLHTCLPGPTVPLSAGHTASDDSGWRHDWGLSCGIHCSAATTPPLTLRTPDPVPANSTCRFVAYTEILTFKWQYTEYLNSVWWYTGIIAATCGGWLPMSRVATNSIWCSSPKLWDFGESH